MNFDVFDKSVYGFTTTDLILFQNSFDFIAPSDLFDVLEYLSDNNCLSSCGLDFKNCFWLMFIKKD